MTDKQTLKDYLIIAPQEKREELELFIDTQISDEDVQNTIKLMDKHRWDHKITNMYYSDQGDFEIKIEKAITYLED